MDNSIALFGLFLLAAAQASAAGFDASTGQAGSEAVASIRKLKGKTSAGRPAAAVAESDSAKASILRCFPKVVLTGRGAEELLFWTDGDTGPHDANGSYSFGFTLDLEQFAKPGPGRAGHFGRGFAMMTDGRNPVQPMIDVIVVPEYAGNVADGILDGFRFEVRQVRRSKKNVPFEKRQDRYTDPEIYASSAGIEVRAVKGSDFTLELPSRTEGVERIEIRCILK